MSARARNTNAENTRGGGGGGGEGGEGGDGPQDGESVVWQVVTFYKQPRFRWFMSGLSDWVLRPFVQGLAFGVAQHGSRYVVAAVARRFKLAPPAPKPEGQGGGDAQDAEQVDADAQGDAAPAADEA